MHSLFVRTPCLWQPCSIGCCGSQAATVSLLPYAAEHSPCLLRLQYGAFAACSTCLQQHLTAAKRSDQGHKKESIDSFPRSHVRSRRRCCSGLMMPACQQAPRPLHMGSPPLPCRLPGACSQHRQHEQRHWHHSSGVAALLQLRESAGRLHRRGRRRALGPVHILSKQPGGGRDGPVRHQLQLAGQLQCRSARVSALAHLEGATTAPLLLKRSWLGDRNADVSAG